MVLVFVETSDDGVREESLEAVTVARSLADETGEPLASALVGEGAGAADTLGEYGVETIYELQSDALTPYAPGAWAAALDEVAATTGSEAILASGIERSQEVLARLGARRDLPFAANCNEITPGDPYTVVRQRWGGSLLEEARIDTRPAILSVTPHERSADPVDAPVDPAIETVDADLDPDAFSVRLDRVEEADIEGIPLPEARVVVGGGRGVGSAEDFDKLEELADELGGTVGSSRAAVNEGWRPHDDQIGLTGAKISPEIYITCGISGAVQHWVGAKGAEHVLAINTDGEAAIIQKSDWAVIADLHEVVPAITEELRRR